MGVMLVCFTLAACVSGLSQQKAAAPVSYADVQRNMKAAIGKRVVWVGKEMESKIMRDAQGKIVEKSRTYLLQAPSPADEDFTRSLNLFVVDDITAQRTAAASKLDETSGDPGIRKLSGTISKLTTVKYYIDSSQREGQFPFISNVTIDAPDATAKK